MASDEGVRLDGRTHDARACERELGDVRGAGECSVRGVRVALQHLGNEVCAKLRMHKHGAIAERMAGFRYGRKRIVVDFHRFRAVKGGVARRTYDRGDDVTHMAHALNGKGGPKDLIHRTAVREVHRVHASEFAVACGGPVPRGDDPQNAWRVARCNDVYTPDARGCVGAAHEGDVGHVIELNVIDEIAASRDEAQVLRPLEPLSDIRRIRGWQRIASAHLYNTCPSPACVRSTKSSLRLR